MESDGSCQDAEAAEGCDVLFRCLVGTYGGFTMIWGYPQIIQKKMIKMTMLYIYIDHFSIETHGFLGSPKKSPTFSESP
jgi:hypothetical protein